MQAVKLGVSVLDELLPEGVLRSSLISVEGEPGTGKSAIVTEIAYRFTQRGEPAIMVCMEDTALSAAQRILALGFDLARSLEGGLVLLDCFSYRIEERLREVKLSPSVSRLREAISGNTVYLSKPGRPEDVWRAVIAEAESRGMAERGAVVLDSITEFLTRVDPAVLLESMKELRADLCKGLIVPVFYTMHFGVFDNYRSIMECFTDGIIDLRFDPNAMKMGILSKQVRVRRMSGVRHLTKWVSFSIAKGEGAIRVGV